MRSQKPNYEYEIEDDLEPNCSNIDPRGFLDAYIYLWRCNKENLTHPLMTGNLVLPVRLIEFTLANARLIPIGGEQCVKFQCSLWESDPVYYTRNRPDYRGHINTFYNGLLPPLDHIYRQLIAQRTGSHKAIREITNVDRMGTLR